MIYKRNIYTHLNEFPQETISILVPFCGLILSIMVIIYALIRLYIFEAGLLKWLYGETYTRLSEINRRGFLNHHIAGITKIIILVLAAYPFVQVVFGEQTFHTRVSTNSPVRMGDLLIVAAQMLIGMYMFELIYRVKVSPVSVIHHVGTIAVGQAAIAINLKLVSEKDGSIEFLLCTVWGAFDIVAELFPHFAIVLYRIYPTSHSFLATIFRFACFSTLIGTIGETILTMYLFGCLWHRWTIAFKIVTPLLHVAFAAAQLNGTWIFFRMWRKERKLTRKGNCLVKMEDGLNGVPSEDGESR